MGLAEQVAQRIGLSLRVIGGAPLVAAKDAERFIAGCQQGRILVLGIEGFRLEGGSLVPDMDAIADFASPILPTLARSIAASRRFLLKVNQPGMWFNFTLQHESG